MTDPVPNPHASDGIAYGHVFASYTEGTADTSLDLDPYPDERWLSGSVTFRPKFAGQQATATLRVPGTPRARGLVITELEYKIVNSRLVDRQDREGVWLTVQVGDIPVHWQATVVLRDAAGKVVLTTAYVLTPEAWVHGLDESLTLNLPDLIPNPALITPSELAAIKSAQSAMERSLEVATVLEEMRPDIEAAGGLAAAAEAAAQTAAAQVPLAKGHADRAEGLAVAQDEHVAGVLEDPESATHAALLTVGNATYAAGSTTGAPAVGQGELTFSVTEFGAVGDGVTDDTAAVQACIAAALAVIVATSGKASVTLPRGTYLVDHNVLYNVIRPAGANLTTGLTFIGDGRTSTILKLKTNGQEAWFYDNLSVDTQRMALLLFYRIGFDADDRELGNGFKQVSKGHEKRFWFFECRFNLGTILQTEGTANADLNRFVNCELYATKAWLSLNNSQSVNHTFINCLLHTLRDGIVVYTGGAVRIDGGSIEMHRHPTDTSPHYLLRKAAPGGLASSEDFVITGIRSEFHGNNKALFYSIDGDMYNPKLTFRDSRLSKWEDDPRTVVHAATSAVVLFDGCFLSEKMLFTASNTVPNDPSGALIMFSKCAAGQGEPLHKRCTVTGAYSRIVADQCYRGGIGRPLNPIILEDFDRGWESQSPQSITARPKVVSIKRAAANFPLPDGQFEFTVEVPDGAFIRSIEIFRPAVARTTATYRLHVGADNKATIHGSSADGLTESNEHRIKVEYIRHTTGIVRVWATGTSTSSFVGASGGYALITYI